MEHSVESLFELSGIRLERSRGLGGPFVRRRSTTVFNGFNLRLPRRGLWLITGPAGAGKSSLLLLLGGRLRPTRGRLLVDGRDYWRLSRRRRRRVLEGTAYLGQDRRAWSLEGESSLREALVRRVEAGRRALLLDDPLAGLDPTASGNLRSELLELAAGRLVVVADPGRGVLEEAAEGIIRPRP